MNKQNITKRKYTSNSSHRELLYFYISELIIKSTDTHKLYEEFYNHTQAASMIFGHGQDGIEYTVRILDNYGVEFFEYKDSGAKNSHFRPRMSELIEHHPEIFNTNSIHQSFKEEIIKALNDERRYAIKNLRNNWINITDIEKTVKDKGRNIYSARIDTEDDDQVINLLEDMKVKIKILNNKYEITVLEFDPKENTLIFRCSDDLKHKKGAIEINCIFLIDKLLDCISNTTLDHSIFRGLFENKIPQLDLEFNDHIICKGLDDKQSEAIIYSLKNGISYIWGPPGTGKSHTLSSLLVNLMQTNERTLVCSIANVAVNSLANKFVDRVDEYSIIPQVKKLKYGDALRVGFIKDKNTIKNSLLFPNSIEISELRDTIEKKWETLAQCDKKDAYYSELKSEIHDHRKKLEELVKYQISGAKIIFATCSKSLIDSTLSNMEFDNIIIDEGSMVSIPYLYALISKTKKRVIISGDYRQLGPIALSSTDMSEKWLKRDLFSLLGKNKKDANCLKMLQTQRRSACEIINLVNKEFYENNLHTEPSKKHKLAEKPLLFKSSHVEFLDLSHMPEYKYEYTASHSRINRISIEAIKSILFKLHTDYKDINSVGIISPYKSQVGLIKKAVNDLKSCIDFKFNILEGTVHTFQGSECDVIIFDMVDSIECNSSNTNSSIGTLYRGECGEKLINVAISRAISKLIIVGCSKVMIEANKNSQVRQSVKSIIKNAYQLSISKNS